MLAAESLQTNIDEPLLDTKPIIVIGTGSAGLKTVSEILQRDPEASIVLYGDEPWEPYNRVHLSTFLSGETRWTAFSESCEIPEGKHLVKRYHCAVTKILPDERLIVDETGRHQEYDKLVIATGSKPHIPAVPGVELPGVFSFRNMSDVQKLQARKVRSRQTVIIGGGVLGLEAARAMQQHSTEVTVVEHSPRLMSRQLDNDAAELLREHVLSLGIKVTLFDGIKSIEGDLNVEKIVLNSGREINCDTVVVVTGIRPNKEIALEAGLSIGRAIKVDNDMRTSKEHIYAVGECAEHKGKVHGLVAPGLEQAAVAANAIDGNKANYQGSIAATQLKVIDYKIFSMGEVGEELDQFSVDFHTYADTSKGIYRKLIIRQHRIIGAIGVGEWPGQGRIQEAITNKRIIWPWQIWRFNSEGELWPVSDSDNVSMWPASAVVCNCTGVTKGGLDIAMQSGCNDAASLCQATGASSVCGSCKPLLARIAGGFIAPERIKGWMTISVATAITAMVVLLTLLASPISYSTTADVAFHIDMLWRDGLFKQISGFTLLGLSVIGAFVSLRKRIKKISFGNYDWWRVFHVVTGVTLVMALVAHTGFRMGDNLNLMLMSAFLGLGVTGILSAGVSLARVKLGMSSAQRMKRIADWMHILVLWPFPVLLTMHVVAVYYF